MARARKIRAKVAHTSNRREWCASVVDGPNLETSGLKPKSARANLKRLLEEHYGAAVEVEWQSEYPTAIQTKLAEVRRMTELGKKLNIELPLLRYEVARELSALHVGQAEIAECIGLSQPYIAQLLQLPPNEAREKLLEAAKRKR